MRRVGAIFRRLFVRSINLGANGQGAASGNARFFSFQYRGVFKRPEFLLFPVLPFKPFFARGCSAATRYQFSNSIPAYKTDAQSYDEYDYECKQDAPPRNRASRYMGRNRPQ
jgi:hypothetical protein